jgi:hypothetical protein
MTYTEKGTPSIFKDLNCYYNPACLVNIISLDLLQAKHHTAFDSEKKNAFTVEVSDALTVTFEGFGSGLYFVNLNTPVNAYPISLLNTVTENKQFFSRREIEGAEAARAQQGQIGWPSDQECYEIIGDNLLTNSKATLDDLRRAEHIFGGTTLGLLKGKTACKPVNTHASIEHTPLPPIIMKTHPSDDLDIDFLHVQGAPCLLMKSTKFHFHATQAFNRISERKKKTLHTTYKRGPQDIINGVEKVLTVFRIRGFQVNLVNADNEFKKLELKVAAHVEICAAGQHVPCIERGMRFLKDRTRCFWGSLPFKKVPKLMVDECLTMVTTCLNDFPSKNGISTTLSPASIALGRGKIDGNNLKANFGRHYEVCCGTDNANKERHTSATCLRPSTSQGGCCFMNLHTGKKIHGYRFTELAMPQHIIDTVHDLADAENAPNLDDDGCPSFEWELGAPVNAEDEAFPPIPPMHAAPDDASAEDDNANNNNADNVDDDPANDDASIGPNNHHEVSDEDESLSDDDVNDNNESISDHTTPDQQPDARSADESIADDSVEPIDELMSEMDPENIVEGKRNSTALTQSNISSFGGKYHVNMLNIGQNTFAKFELVKTELHSTAVGVCFNQMTASKGIKLCGAKAVAAMFKEHKQLDDLEVLGRLTPENITHEQKRNALRAVKLIKIKRDGRVKGRTCADGSTQRNYVAEGRGLISHFIFGSAYGNTSNQRMRRTRHSNIRCTRSALARQNSRRQIRNP